MPGTPSDAACGEERVVSDDSMQSKIVATVLGLVAEIERDFISARTKEGQAKR